MMTDQEHDDVKAIVLNLLTDNWIQAGTGDYHYYEVVKNLVHNSRVWTPE